MSRTTSNMFAPRRSARRSAYRDHTSIVEPVDVASAPAPEVGKVVRLATPPAKRWSKRKTLAYVLLTCGGFWVAVILTVLIANR